MRGFRQHIGWKGFAGSSGSPYWTPQNIVITPISGGVRITYTPHPGTETEIYVSIDGGAKSLITTTGLTIGTYDYTCDTGIHTFLFELRSKLDQTILNAPSGLTTSEISQGVVRITWADNNTEADHIQLWANIAGAGFALITTVTTGVQTHDHSVGINATVIYKVRAKEGTLPVYSSYSSTSTITISDVPIAIVDGDGNVYTEITIGAQTWLNRNLITTKYNDGTSIPRINCVTNAAAWAADTVGAFDYPMSDVANVFPYGCKYNGYGKNLTNLCPIGYHIPTNAEIATLIAFLGGASVAGGKLKEIGTTHFAAPNTGATDDYAFHAVGTGYINPAGADMEFYYATYLASSVWGVLFLGNTTAAATPVTTPYSLKYGWAIRPIKDAA